jgi:hypothetical protein
MPAIRWGKVKEAFLNRTIFFHLKTQLLPKPKSA